MKTHRLWHTDLAFEPDALLPRSVQYATTDRPAPKEAS